VAYEAKIMPLKVLSAQGFGSVANIAEAVRFAADHGAKVINMSLGGRTSSKILAQAVKYAHDKGVVVVCAAGNDGSDRVSFPAAYPGAIAVAATQYDRTTTFYSNWGREIALAAPGGNTRLDQNGDGMPDGVLQNTILPGHPDQNDYLLFMGTSMASPHVAGVAALLVGAGINKPDAVEEILKSTAVNPSHQSWDPHFGAGIVKADAALDRAKQTYGAATLGLALFSGLFIMLRLRRQGRLAVRPGPGSILGLLLGSSALFFLPSLVGMDRLHAFGSGACETALSLLSRGIPDWDGVLFSPAFHGVPLFQSLLLPLLLAVFLWGVPRLKGLLFGLMLGVSCNLAAKLLLGSIDVLWIPNVLCLDEAWLFANSLLGLYVASLIARR
jgi:serine protease